MERIRPILLLWTPDRKELIEKVQKKLQVLLTSQPIETELHEYKFFADWSPNIAVESSVRGKHVYILSDVYSDAPDEEWDTPSINDRYHFSSSFQRVA